jgi:hypothetical protein
MQHLAAKSILPKNSERLIAIRTWAIRNTGHKGRIGNCPAGRLVKINRPNLFEP